MNEVDEFVYDTRVDRSAFLIIGRCSAENAVNGFENRFWEIAIVIVIALKGVEKLWNDVQVTYLSYRPSSGGTNVNAFVSFIQCLVQRGNGFRVAKSSECIDGFILFAVFPRFQLLNELVYSPHRSIHGYLRKLCTSSRSGLDIGDRCGV